ncbi:Aspartic proteinase CDR1 [Linum perenne]
MSPYSPLQFFLFIISTLIFSTSHGFNITIPLIHRDSIYSPLYNATETIEDRAQRVAKASLDRYEYLSSALSIRPLSIRPEANLVPGFKSHLFFINFSIGTPWVPQLALMDTASAFLWVKCKPCSPCDHGPKDPPIFDPANSRTIYEVPFGAQKEWSLWSDKKCKFAVHHGGGRVSEGIYVKDRINFQTSVDGRTSVTIKNFLFGCSNYIANRGKDIDNFSGVIGLGPSKPESSLEDFPLIWELGSQFSYCVGRFSDRSYRYNSISFGKNARMIGKETPMYTGDGGYHVNLVNISIGGKVTFIYVCYGTVDKEAVGFPPMVFHFQDGAQLQVESVGLFAQADDDAFCLAIHGVKVPKGISVIGMKAQQGYNVGFDLQGIPLIHRDSVYSPLYNASETISDRAQRIVEASRGRHDYLSLLFSDDVRPQTKLIPGPQAKLTPGSNNFAFFLNISLGDPPLPQLVLMDTGSDFLWVKCKPCNEECKHDPGDPEIYDPAKSKTSYELPCLVGCDKCTEYADGRVSEGTYAIEKLTLQTSNNRRSKVTVPNILFGCSRYTTFRLRGMHFSGIMGLGPSRDPKVELGYPSLVSDLGNKFSYCTGRLSDRYYPHNQISFGGDSHLMGRSTPFNAFTGNYFVNLVNISLGSKMSYIHGVSIDSGSELSFLYNEVFNVLKVEVSKMAESLLVGVPVKFPYELCYKGSVYREARDFPPIGIQFIGEGKLVLDNFGMFKQVEDDKFCLAFLRTDSISLIGMLAQQGYNIGYDLLGERLYIKDIDCQTV